MRDVAVLGGLAVLAGLFGAPVTGQPSDDMQGQFWDAIQREDVQTVARMLGESPGLRELRDTEGWTPLSRAAHEGRTATVKLLVGKGADVNARGPCGGTPLYHAVRQGHGQVAQLLLDAGAGAWLADEDGWTPLRLALINDDEAMAQELLAHGVPADACTMSALGDVAQLRSVLTDVTEPTGGWGAGIWGASETPLHWAARNGHNEAAELLLTHGVQVDAGTKHVGTPLFWAVSKAPTETVELLLGWGARVDSAAWTEEQPLHLAALAGRVSAVEALLAAGADPDAAARLAGTPLHWAAAGGQVEAARVLLEAGADVHARCVTWVPWWDGGYTGGPRGPVRWMAFLTGRGTWVDGFTLPRDWLDVEFRGSLQGFVDAARREFDEGFVGFAPLHWAAVQGATDVAELLLQSGASPTALGLYHGSPLHWAARGGHMEAAEALIAHGASAEASTLALGTPLHWAVRTGQVNMCAFLLANGAPVGSRDGNGRTPLHLAALYGQLEPARELVAASADIGARDNDGRTAEALALASGHPELAEMLGPTAAE